VTAWLRELHDRGVGVLAGTDTGIDRVILDGRVFDRDALDRLVGDAEQRIAR
jgi:hypothetical protein